MGQDELQFQMNRALDEELSAQELEALKRDVRATRETTERWDKLRKTDHLLRTTPMVHPAEGFASRVMAAISALPLPGIAQRHPGVGLALGLALAALFVVPVLWIVLWLLLGVLTDPGALNSLLQTLVNGLGTLVGVGGDVLDAVREAMQGTPLLIAFVALAVSLTALWGWLMWALWGRTAPRTRRQKS